MEEKLAILLMEPLGLWTGGWLCLATWGVGAIWGVGTGVAPGLLVPLQVGQVLGPVPRIGEEAAARKGEVSCQA